MARITGEGTFIYFGILRDPPAPYFDPPVYFLYKIKILGSKKVIFKSLSRHRKGPATYVEITERRDNRISL